jgi:uncharacterized protein YdeI (YjbR/CyaY-like superfamily)
MGSPAKTTTKAKRARGKAPSHGRVPDGANLPELAFTNRREWAKWLTANGATSRGGWLVFAKKGSGAASITYLEALEEALAWGWIDGQARSKDRASWLQRFTPRSPRSIWSKINRDRALALIAAGRMKRRGLDEVERAKRDGRWEAAYEPQSRATVPKDLQLGLAANPRAAAFFATLNSQNRYAVLFRIHGAKKPETRAARIARFVQMLAKHEKLHP